MKSLSKKPLAQSKKTKYSKKKILSLEQHYASWDVNWQKAPSLIVPEIHPTPHHTSEVFFIASIQKSIDKKTKKTYEVASKPQGGKS